MTRESSGRSENPDHEVIGVQGLAEALTEDEMYGALTTFGRAIVRAGQGTVTEIRDLDGEIIALVTPPRPR